MSFHIVSDAPTECLAEYYKMISEFGEAPDWETITTDQGSQSFKLITNIDEKELIENVENNLSALEIEFAKVKVQDGMLEIIWLIIDECDHQPLMNLTRLGSSVSKFYNEFGCYYYEFRIEYSETREEEEEIQKV